jgi:PAS domain S-box-containing protein
MSQKFIRNFPRAAGVAVALFGCLVIIAWYAHWRLVLQLVPDTAPMQYNTALCFILSGAALFLLTTSHSRIALWLSGAAWLISFLTLLQYLTGLDFGIDLLFYKPYFEADRIYSGRMSPLAAACFVLMTTGLLLAGLKRLWPQRLTAVGLLGVIVAIMAAVALFGYIFGISSASGWGAYARMAVNSAIAFLLLNLGLLAWAWRAAPQEDINFLRWLPVTASLTLMAMIGFVSALNMQQLKVATLWRTHTIQVILAGQTFENNLIDIQRGMRGYVTMGDTNALASFEVTSTNEARQFDQLVELTSDNPSQQARLKELAVAINAIFDYDHRTLGIYKNQGADAVLQTDKTGEGRAVLGRARDILKSFSAEEQQLLNLRDATEQADYHNTEKLLVTGVALAALLLVLANLMASREISLRRQMELVLRDNEERSRLLIEGVKDYAIFMLDSQGRVATWNSGAEKIKGYKSAEIIGSHFSRFYPPEALVENKPEKELAEAIANGSVRDEGWRLRKDGSRFYASVVITPVRSPNGQLRGFTKITRDITERRNAALKLAEHAAQLQRSNQELEQFAYVASHDMKEPLRAISGFSQILKSRYQGKLDADADKNIAHIVDGAKRMGSLIDDLLALSRVGSQGKPFEKTGIEKSLLQAQANLAVAIDERKAVITHDTLPVLPVDGSQLTLLFQNLLANSIKFCRDCDPRVHVGAKKNGGDFWEIFVIDNGIGIEPKYFDRIFGIFQRLHTRDEYPGTGIGLAICKKIVERHGGKIWLESKPDAGTTFHFTLPEKQQDAS